MRAYFSLKTKTQSESNHIHSKQNFPFHGFTKHFSVKLTIKGSVISKTPVFMTGKTKP